MKASSSKPGSKTHQVRQDRQRTAAQHGAAGEESASRATLVDNRPGAIAQRTLRGAINQSPRMQQLAEQQAAIDTSPRQVAQRQQRAQMAPRNTEVVQRAGTKPTQPSTDGRYRIKLSSEREKFSYENRVALGLDHILPEHHPLIAYQRKNSTSEVVAVQLQNQTWVTLKTPIPEPSGGKQLLCIDTVGFQAKPRMGRAAANTTGNTKLFIDVKIGHYTKSGQQWELEGANWFEQKLKKAEHEMKDRWRTSRETGYDIDGANLKEFEAAHLKARAGQDNDALWTAMDSIRHPLEDIGARMAKAPVTFVGASVFIVLNLTDPLSSDVKIIDPDHPILLDSPVGMAPVPTGVMDSGKMVDKRDWGEYKDKWQQGFGSGMTNFVGWWKTRTQQIFPELK